MDATENKICQLQENYSGSLDNIRSYGKPQ